MHDIAVLRIRKGTPGHGRKIARALDAYEVTANARPAQRLSPTCVIINYGRSTVPVWLQPRQLLYNHPEAVIRSANKLTSSLHFHANGVPHLEGTTERQEAQRWLNQGEKVYCRTILTGKRGRGIVVVEPGEELVDAPLYTKSFPVAHEFRVHCATGADGVLRIVDYVQKKRMGKKKLVARGLTEVNMASRNRRFGWVFCHNDIIDSPAVRDVGLQAVKAVGLDWGAADVLMDRHGHAVACEVNSAPAVGAPTTFNAYIKVFQEVIRNHDG